MFGRRIVAGAAGISLAQFYSMVILDYQPGVESRSLPTIVTLRNSGKSRTDFLSTNDITVTLLPVLGNVHSALLFAFALNPAGVIYNHPLWRLGKLPQASRLYQTRLPARSPQFVRLRPQTKR